VTVAPYAYDFARACGERFDRPERLTVEGLAESDGELVEPFCLFFPSFHFLFLKNLKNRPKIINLLLQNSRI
jgi:hypothetical protein